MLCMKDTSTHEERAMQSRSREKVRKVSYQNGFQHADVPNIHIFIAT